MSRLAPVFVLFFLSPLLAEFVFGATPISRLESMLLLVFLYGGAAVLIREVARGHGPGWGRILLLAAAYGIFEEGLLIQSMFNPDLFNAGIVGGRATGVNWIWSLWTVGYHVVYSIATPILLTETLFPARRAQPWLGWKGLTIFGVLFAISAFWLGLVFRMFIAPSFRTPLPQAIGTILIIIGLVALALRPSDKMQVDSSEPLPRRVPSPWLVGSAGVRLHHRLVRTAPSSPFPANGHSLATPIAGRSEEAYPESRIRDLIGRSADCVSWSLEQPHPDRTGNRHIVTIQF